MTAPAQTPYEEITALRHAILQDLADCESASDIAERRHVTMATALALLFEPEHVTLCRYCRASGNVTHSEGAAVISEPCRACASSGYITEVKIA